MTDASYIDDAVEWAADIVRWKSRGSGDTDNALRRAARESGLSYSLWKRLRYERHRVTGIYHDQFERLRSYYVTECERVERIAAHSRARVLEQRETAHAAHSGVARAPSMADGGSPAEVASLAPAEDRET